MADYFIHGTGSISDLTSDFILYRSLDPLDTRLPRFVEMKDYLHLETDQHPRKSDPEYGEVCAACIRNIARIEGKPEPRRLLFFGDTLYNDGSAFRNILRSGGWEGAAFIGKDDRRDQPVMTRQENIFSANRWSLLDGFLSEVNLSLDEETVLVLDLDKTALGARGRNDSPIDHARVAAMQQTIQAALQGSLDLKAFQQAYDTLNQPEFHPFTGDNQDYLAYLCLMLSGGVMELNQLVQDIRRGIFLSFAHFLELLQQDTADLERNGLLQAHTEVWNAVQSGDPTPYKNFRKAEFLATLDRFTTDLNAPLDKVLNKCITITAEVYDAARKLQLMGATVLGISDKPDLSSIPDEQQAHAGILPLHRQQTLIIGELEG